MKSNEARQSTERTGAVSDADESALAHTRMQIALRRRAAQRAQERNQSTQDPNQCGGDPTSRQPALATPEERDAARETLDRWRSVATSAVLETAQWFSDNYGEFVRKTGSNNRLGWTDGRFYDVLEGVGGYVAKKLVTGVGGALAGVETGGATALASVFSWVMEKLAEKIVKTISDEIKGTKEKKSQAVEEAVGRSNDLANHFFEQAAEGQAQIAATFDQLKSQLIDVESVERIQRWAQRELSQIGAPPKGDRSLFHRMYSDWALEHAGDRSLIRREIGPGENVDPKQWEAAVDAEHGGKITKRFDLFAYQTRGQLTEAGLPTEQADALIQEARRTHPLDADRFDGRKLSFKVPRESAQLHAFLCKNGAAKRANLEDIESGAFTITCTLHTALERGFSGEGGTESFSLDSCSAKEFTWSASLPNRYESEDPVDAGLPSFIDGEQWKTSTFTTKP